jgi:glycerol uptake facilitator-like aquaporin
LSGVQREKNRYSSVVLPDCSVVFFVKKNEKTIYGSLITAVKKKYKRTFFTFLFSFFLYLFILAISAFIYSACISIIRGHYSIVTITAVFIFSLRYVNKFFLNDGRDILSITCFG